MKHYSADLDLEHSSMLNETKCESTYTMYMIWHIQLKELSTPCIVQGYICHFCVKSAALTFFVGKNIILNSTVLLSRYSIFYCVINVGICTIENIIFIFVIWQLKTSFIGFYMFCSRINTIV